MIVCSIAAAEETKSIAAGDVKSSSTNSDRSKRGLYATSLVASPYAPAYAAPYAAPYVAPYTTPYVAPYTAPYVAPYTAPYAAPYAAPYTVAAPYVPSYSAYPYGYTSSYGFY